MTTITAQDPGYQDVGQEQTAYRPSLIRQLGIDTAYVLVGFPLSIVVFVLVITGFSLSAGLLVTLLGIPVLVATLFIARGFAELERARITSVIHTPRVRVRYKKTNRTASIWRRPFSTLSDIQAWLDMLHAIIRFPVSTAAFSIVVTWWAVALGGVTYGLWDWSLPHSPDNYELPEILGFSDTAQTRISFYMVIGAVFALTLPFVVRGCALVEGWLARGMLTGVAQLRDQVAYLAEDRAYAQGQTAAAVSAEATALRRLERDIHDGPQQRLVRLAVDLGRAKQQMTLDPTAAATTVDEALTQTREALNELRTLSRGIAPPILTDRGLPAAVAALAARCTIPVSLDDGDGLPRLDPLAEQTAYFTIAEALTNVAKHSGAERCTISLRSADGRLTVGIFDDGHGGAHLSKGHGLAGLADRLHAAGGQLWVSSPSGGPTSVTAELPCQIAT
jgi:signal transduction histidine kinase